MFTWTCPHCRLEAPPPYTEPQNCEERAKQPDSRGAARSGPAPTSTVESPAGKAGAKTKAVQKQIEVAGVRFVTEPKKKGALVKFVVSNHSDSEISGLAGNVTIWGRTQKSE